VRFSFPVYSDFKSPEDSNLIPYWGILFHEEQATAHTIRDKKKLLFRVRRLRGQIEAVERALDEERSCAEVLQIIAACRGAINGLMAELLEGHIRYHVIDPDTNRNSHSTQAAEELIEVLRSYLR